jgi:hypothetical protein
MPIGTELFNARIVLRILALFLLFQNNSCVSTKTVLPTDDNLRIRVKQLYGYLQDEDYEKYIELSINYQPQMKGHAEKYFRDNYRFKVTSHQIDSIVRIDELNAKVIVIMYYRYKQDEKERSVAYGDCWSFRKGNWYITDMHRTPDWKCQALSTH